MPVGIAILALLICAIGCSRPPKTLEHERAPTELQEIYNYIDAQVEQHLADLQNWVKQPGISRTGEGVRESAEMVKGFFQRLGCQKAWLDDAGGRGHPVVYARCDEGAPHTLLMYWAYDTAPVPQAEDWRVPPLEGRVLAQPPFKRVLIGLGAASKGPAMAMLNALMSIKAVAGKLPVNLIVAGDGDAELFSTGLRALVTSRPELFQEADAVWAGGMQDASGLSEVGGASEGCTTFELTTSGAKWGKGPTDDIHGGLGRIVGNPAWRHVQMLATLVSADGKRVEVEGFYDGIDTKDQTFLELDGIGAGLPLEHSGAIIPGRITSTHRIRYRPPQSGIELADKIRRQLDTNGYQDVDLKVTADLPSHDNKIAVPDLPEAQLAALRLFGVEPAEPLHMDSPNPRCWPASLFAADPLNLSVSRAGVGYGGNRNEPNEYYVIDGGGVIGGLAAAVKFHATVVYEFASRKQAGASVTSKKD